MRKLFYAFIVVTAFSWATFVGCKSEEKKAVAENQQKPDQTSLIARGRYLTTIGGCNDCHTPKIMTPNGPMADTTRAFSGHPQLEKISIGKALLEDKNWVKMSAGITAFIGPWGISYGSNLTPDSTTGIGNWTEEVFIKTLRTGKHLGQDGGRPVLPPMPWYYIGQMTDEDLAAVYAYFKSLPPIQNRVPAPVPPSEIKAD